MLKELKRKIIASWKHIELLEIQLEWWKRYEATRRVGWKNAVAGLIRHVQNKSYIVIEQYRYPMGKKVLELVAGVIDKPWLTPQEIMKEEVIEESGYRDIKNIEFLSLTSASAWKSTELTTLYDIEVWWEKWSQKLWEMEDIKLFEIPYKDFDRFLSSKAQSWTIIDPKVCMAVYMAWEKTWY